MTADDLIAVLQAHKQGKQILDHGYGCDFKVILETSDYRIKPEPPKPREWWLANRIAYETLYAAEKFYDVSGTSPIHVREVLPET